MIVVAVALALTVGMYHAFVEPAQPYFFRGLGYAWQGNSENAIADFDRAIELNPTDADYYRNRVKPTLIKET